MDDFSPIFANVLIISTPKSGTHCSKNLIWLGDENKIIDILFKSVQHGLLQVAPVQGAMEYAKKYKTGIYR